MKIVSIRQKPPARIEVRPLNSGKGVQIWMAGMPAPIIVVTGYPIAIDIHANSEIPVTVDFIRGYENDAVAGIYGSNPIPDA